MNRLSIIGNLTRDVELTQTSSGISVVRFSVAVNRRYAGADGNHLTDFFNVSAWRGLAENAAKFLKKGSKVYVSGPITFDTYKDKNGNNQTSATVTAEDIEFLSARAQTVEAAPEPAKVTLEPMDDDGDIPF